MAWGRTEPTLFFPPHQPTKAKERATGPLPALSTVAVKALLMVVWVSLQSWMSPLPTLLRKLALTHVQPRVRAPVGLQRSACTDHSVGSQSRLAVLPLSSAALAAAPPESAYFGGYCGYCLRWLLLIDVLPGESSCLAAESSVVLSLLQLSIVCRRFL